MNRIKLSLLLTIILSFKSFSQGCSDAGFCTVHGLQANINNQDSLNNTLKIGGYYGAADNDISVYGNYLEFGKQINALFRINAKLTTLGQIGNGISTFGLADVFLNVNYRATDDFHITIGGKAPLIQGDASSEGLALPMDYQSSLGTFDLILGLAYEFDKLQITAGLQQPLSQNNNQFLASEYPLGSDLRSIKSTRGFQRAGDALLRVSYPLKSQSKLKFTPSLLSIYHLANDQYLDEFDQTQEIEGSEGLTVNINVLFDISISSRSSFQLNAAVPLLVREARPDGLTRSFIANLEYQVRF